MIQPWQIVLVSLQGEVRGQEGRADALGQDPEHILQGRIQRNLS